MRKIAALLLSATVLAAPLLSAGQAAAYDHRRGPVVEKKVIIKKHSWKRGHRVTREERRYFRSVNDYRRYRLAAPPRGYHWVRVDNRFLLVGITSGLISQVIIAR